MTTDLIPADLEDQIEALTCPACGQPQAFETESMCFESGAQGLHAFCLRCSFDVAAQDNVVLYAAMRRLCTGKLLP